jgi:hypothetical protein
MIFICRARSDAENDEGHARSDQIDHRLERIRKQADRTGDPVCGAFHHDDDGGSAYRQPGEMRERRTMLNHFGSR